MASTRYTSTPAYRSRGTSYGVRGASFGSGGSGLARYLAGAAAPGFTLPDYTPRISPTDTSFGGSLAAPSADNLLGPGAAAQAGVPAGSPQVRPLPGPTPGATSGPGGSGGAGQGGGVPNPHNLSYEGDPILQKIRALNEAAVQSAHAAELSKRKQAFIGFGHQAGTPTDIYPDAATAQAAEQNPFSTLAQLQFAHGRRQQGIDTGTNAANLFYSSTRGQALGDESRQFQLEQTNANNALAGLLGGYNQEVLGAEQGATQANMDAESGAYQRALDFALQYGVDPSQFGLAGGKAQIGGFEMPFVPKGYTGEQVAAAAIAYGSGRGLTPHMVMQEGTVTYQNGVPGVMVKYVDAQGSSTTEWTPLPPLQQPGAAPPPGSAAPPPGAVVPPVANAPLAQLLGGNYLGARFVGT